MKTGIYALIIVGCLLMIGCRTFTSKTQVTKDVTLHILMVTDDVLSIDVGEHGIKGIANRIKRYTTSKLNDYSINISEGAINKGDYSLIIHIDTIESETSFSARPGFFHKISVDQETKIKYSAELFTDDGRSLFVLTDDESDESIDEITEDIGSDVAERVVKFFTEESK